MLKRIERIKCFLTKNQGTHIFIACFPKSGSTYLASILREITGFRRGRLAFGLSESRGLDISKKKIEKYRGINTVSKQHLVASDNNIHLLRKYDYRVVVLVRNLYDVVLSLHDYIDREPYRTTGYIHKGYFEMSMEDKLMYLIRIHLPWYFNFLVSWEEVADQIPLLWVSYEEIFTKQLQILSSILDFHSLPLDNMCINKAVQVMKNRDTRFNVGKKGRGVGLLDSHKKAILEIAKCWRVDPLIMERIGIHEATS